MALPATAADGAIDLVSRAGDAAPGDDVSLRPAISADGQYVAFESAARNLVGDPGPSGRSVYLRDVQAGITTLVARQSMSDGGAPANESSFAPSVSPDGRYVAFSSRARNLSTLGPLQDRNIYVRDVQAGTTSLVSRQSASDGGEPADDGGSPSISASGRYVAF